MDQLIEIQYFGCICFYVQLIKKKYLILEQFETYQKMSFRNRCQIAGPLTVIDLTVPLLGGRDQKEFTRNVRVDNGQQWQVQHWRTLESCYNKSAFFLHYKEELKQVLFSPYETLWALNEATIKWVLQKLKGQVSIIYTSEFKKQAAEDCLDLRNQFLPANRKTQSLKTYQQVYENPFEPNLSILDLLFNRGPLSKQYLLEQQF